MPLLVLPRHFFCGGNGGLSIPPQPGRRPDGLGGKKKNPPGFEEKRLPCVIPLTENKIKVQGNYETPNRGD